METKLLYVALCAAIILSNLVFYNLGKNAQLQQMHEVYTICADARGMIDGASEQACDDAQDRTHTNYLCNPSGNCWVEVQ